MSIFARLNFDSSFQGGNITPMSNNVINHMNTMPQMLNTWQTADVASSNTSGYFQNPVANTANNIWNVANTIISITNLATTNVAQILTAANALYIAANNFVQHTNRMSGVSGSSADDPTLPTYQSAVGTGKLISYIVFQSDNVQNNAPILGSFTSLYSGNNLSYYYSTIQNTAIQVRNSIIDANTSNLTQTQANTIASNIANTASFMNTRRTADVTFFLNSQAVLSDYNKTKQFSNMGSTETGLVNNLIGSPKLLSRLNS